MKRFYGSLIAGSTLLVGTAHATLLYSFETGIEGMHSWDGAGIAQSTIGATEGSHSLAVSGTGFHWVETDVSQSLATNLSLGHLLAMDVTVTQSVGNWANTLMSFNDATGWRQTLGFNLPNNPGTQTVILDYSSLSAPDYNAGNWFKMSFSINSDTGGTFYIDNIRTVPEPATLLALAGGVGALFLRRRKS